MAAEAEIESILKSMLVDTGGFMDNLYHFEIDGLGPKPIQKGVCIKQHSAKDLREDFIESMVAIILDFVYPEERQDAEIGKIRGRGHSKGQAFSLLAQAAQKKFRQYSPKMKNNQEFGIKGQFSELLLFVFLQNFFQAVPVLRKMPLITSNKFERYGFDALHIGTQNGVVEFILGEAKTYDREKNALRAAIEESISSVINHHELLREELGLYIHEEFIPLELEELTYKYMKMIDGPYKETYVCLCCYQANLEFDSLDADAKNKSVMKMIGDEMRKWDNMPWKPHAEKYLPNLHLLLFPIADLGQMLKTFRQKLWSLPEEKR
jgi:hypothetical protein